VPTCGELANLRSSLLRGPPLSRLSIPENEGSEMSSSDMTHTKTQLSLSLSLSLTHTHTHTPGMQATAIVKLLNESTLHTRYADDGNSDSTNTTHKSANTEVVVTMKSGGTLAATSAELKHVKALTKPQVQARVLWGCHDEEQV
jgi:hypothetical protein